jgi:hypothetical protein
LLSVTYLHHQDEEDLILNLVDDAVVLPGPHVDPIQLLLCLHLLHSVRTRIFFQTEEVPVYLLPDIRIELAKISLRGGSDFNPVG